MLKDCDNLISLGTRSHIFGPRNEMDSVSCLSEFIFAIVMYNFAENFMCVRRAQIYHLKWLEKNHASLCKFLLQAFVRFYDVFIRSCLFLIVPEMLKICLFMLFLKPFHVYDLFYY